MLSLNCVRCLSTAFFSTFLIRKLQNIIACSVHTVVAPIERVKLLLQTQDGNAALLGRARKFRGFADCVARTVRDEGVLSLWRGNGTAVIRYYPSVALNFSLKVLSLPQSASHPTAVLLSIPFVRSHLQQPFP